MEPGGRVSVTGVPESRQARGLVPVTALLRDKPQKVPPSHFLPLQPSAATAASSCTLALEMRVWVFLETPRTWGGRSQRAAGGPGASRPPQSFSPHPVVSRVDLILIELSHLQPQSTGVKCRASGLPAPGLGARKMEGVRGGRGGKGGWGLGDGVRHSAPPLLPSAFCKLPLSLPQACSTPAPCSPRPS